MNITYRKVQNTDLFMDLENSNLVNAKNCQNYIPIYNNFFKLSTTNNNGINLNHVSTLTSITDKISDNKYIGTITDHSDENNKTICETTIFIKYAPLLDPFKFLAGKYEVHSFDLPKFDSKSKFEKIDCPNNSAYVDSFFLYLSSQLLHCKDFLHGVNFYE